MFLKGNFSISLQQVTGYAGKYKKPYNSTTEFLQIYYVAKIIKIGYISSDFKNQKDDVLWEYAVS